jgi:hypothetical protein
MIWAIRGGPKDIVFQQITGHTGKLCSGTRVAQNWFGNWIGFSKRKRMLVYKAKKRVSVKWILAGIIFVAVLCITFNDLYGAGFPF